jgi:glycosyltransferase involved in cell wall biosynthesis
MKILYCLSHINKSLQWEWFAEEMKKREIELIFVLIDLENRIEFYIKDDLQRLGFKVYVLKHKGKISHLKNILKTIAIIRKHKIDIVHTSLPFGNLVGQTAAMLSGINKRVTTCENVSWAHDFHNKKQVWIDDYTFRKSKRIIATSEIAADYLRKNWDFNKLKLSVIYHGLKCSDYEVNKARVEALGGELQIEKNKNFIVGVIARFEFWKGHEYIIEAARILKDNSEIKFYIFGSKGSYYDEAMKKISEYNLQQHIIYGGFIEDTSALYQLFDVHLHVPVNEYVETGGITIIEGMMAERPQVLTLSGYAWQSAKHMHNAYIVPFKNAEAIAEAIIWMKNNSVKAGELAKQAKNDAKEMFGINSKVDKHLTIYNELMK